MIPVNIESVMLSVLPIPVPSVITLRPAKAEATKKDAANKEFSPEASITFANARVSGGASNAHGVSATHGAGSTHGVSAATEAAEHTMIPTETSPAQNINTAAQSQNEEPHEQRPTNTDCVLPIWVGSAEASAIAAALEGKKSARPLTHTLMNEMLTTLGGHVARVIIDRVEGSTFYASILIAENNGKITSIDARPSDAIALAIRTNAPLFVEEDVLEAAAAPVSMSPGAEEKIQMEEFHNFVENLNPNDFSQKESHEE